VLGCAAVNMASPKSSLVDFSAIFSAEDITLEHFVVILARLGIAFALGSLLAHRPWRRLMRDRPPPPQQTAQAQALIAVVGALLIAVIGESTARAFGLVGMGGFLRFRSVIKDTRDAAIMFVMIGIGMACGLGLVPIAAVGCGFFSLILFFFDSRPVRRLRRLRINVSVAQPRVALPQLTAALPGARPVEVATGESGTLLLEWETALPVDAATLLERLELAGVAGIDTLTVEDA
jgi:uncharacterized protein DUF4956